jgi:hypothetical protein
MEESYRMQPLTKKKTDKRKHNIDINGNTHAKKFRTTRSATTRSALARLFRCACQAAAPPPASGKLLERALIVRCATCAARVGRTSSPTSPMVVRDALMPAQPLRAAPAAQVRLPHRGAPDGARAHRALRHLRRTLAQFSLECCAI